MEDLKNEKWLETANKTKVIEVEKYMQNHDEIDFWETFIFICGAFENQTINSQS